MQTNQVTRRGPKTGGLRPVTRPHPLLDHARELAGAANDRELADRLCVSAPSICKVRAGDLPAGSTLLVRLHETLDISFATMRALLKECK